MKFILGKKLEMTQKYSEDGEVIPVTKVLAGPCFVTQLKTNDRDSYQAVQLGFEYKRGISKSLKGHLKKLGNIRYLKEFRIKDVKPEEKFKVGDKIEVSVFNTGDIVKVTGISKGKGFQGVVKRWGFHGSPASHGHKDQLRMTGSIGATEPKRVFKGKKMPGRMGGQQVTITNLEIVDIDKDNNYLYIKGAIPGSRNSLVWIQGEGEMEMASKSSEASEASGQVE